MKGGIRRVQKWSARHAAVRFSVEKLGKKIEGTPRKNRPGRAETPPCQLSVRGYHCGRWWGWLEVGTAGTTAGVGAVEADD
jgi:hypothetical protein